jgi:hypothetical protein
MEFAITAPNVLMTPLARNAGSHLEMDKGPAIRRVF